ncbi:MAG: tripartite tricarboxylate transporter TctB family protein [Paracoccaceae bacterium]
MMRTMSEGVALLAISLFAIIGVWNVPAASDNETWAGVVPFGAGLGLLIISGMMIFGAFRNASDDQENTSAEASVTLEVLTLFAIALLYQQSMRWFGYVLPTAIAAPVVLYIFGVRNWIGLAISVVVCPLIYHVIFFELLGVFPPFGEVFDLLDTIKG